MQRDPRAWLWDVREAARAIEALNQLAKADPASAGRIPHLAQIVAFRNLLIHGYAVVDHQTVWGVIEHSLPSLLQAVEAVLNEIGSQ